MNGKRISIIMPTFNSERTIELSFRSILAQTYPRELVEILVVDGGSSDRTCELARAVGAIVIPNPKTHPEYAKHIGLLQAKGDVAVFLDSDEELANPSALENRVRAFEKNPGVRTLMCGGYRKPEGASSANDYLNIFSDPFTWFMYGTTSEEDTKAASWADHYRKEGAVFWFKDGPLPLVDYCAGNTIDLVWAREALKTELKEVIVVPRLFYEILAKGGGVMVLENDPIIHHSADSFAKLFWKIRWRVVGNIHYAHVPATGFVNREHYESRSRQLRKYLFVPYALTMVLPIVDSLGQFARTRKPATLVHPPLAFATASLILFYYGLKVVGYRPRLKTYGDETKDLAL